MYFHLLVVLLFGLIWIGIVTFLLLKKKESLIYVIFFTVFYFYLFKVLDYTLFQFQALLLLKHFMPELILNGQAAGKRMNFTPLVAHTSGYKDLASKCFTSGSFRLRAAVHYESSHEEGSCYWRAL
jgi:hypothetical protein